MGRKHVIGHLSPQNGQSLMNNRSLQRKKMIGTLTGDTSSMSAETKNSSRSTKVLIFHVWCAMLNGHCPDVRTLPSLRISIPFHLSFPPILHFHSWDPRTLHIGQLWWVSVPWTDRTIWTSLCWNSKASQHPQTHWQHFDSCQRQWMFASSISTKKPMLGRCWQSLSLRLRFPRPTSHKSQHLFWGWTKQAGHFSNSWLRFLTNLQDGEVFCYEQ